MKLWDRLTGARPSDRAPGAPSASAGVVGSGVIAAAEAWRTLPPIQRQLAAITPTVQPAQFEKSLSTWRNPGVIGELEHGVSPLAPAGLLADVLQPRDQARTDDVARASLPVFAPSASPQGVVQRVAAGTVSSGPIPGGGVPVQPEPMDARVEPSPAESGNEQGFPEATPAPATIVVVESNATASPLQSVALQSVPVVARSIRQLQRLTVLAAPVTAGPAAWSAEVAAAGLAPGAAGAEQAAAPVQRHLMAFGSAPSETGSREPATAEPSATAAVSGTAVQRIHADEPPVPALPSGLSDGEPSGPDPGRHRPVGDSVPTPPVSSPSPGAPSAAAPVPPTVGRSLAGAQAPLPPRRLGLGAPLPAPAGPSGLLGPSGPPGFSVPSGPTLPSVPAVQRETTAGSPRPGATAPQPTAACQPASGPDQSHAGTVPAGDRESLTILRTLDEPTPPEDVDPHLDPLDPVDPVDLPAERTASRPLTVEHSLIAPTPSFMLDPPSSSPGSASAAAPTLSRRHAFEFSQLPGDASAHSTTAPAPFASVASVAPPTVSRLATGLPATGQAAVPVSQAIDASPVQRAVSPIDGPGEFGPDLAAPDLAADLGAQEYLMPDLGYGPVSPAASPLLGGRPPIASPPMRSDGDRGDSVRPSRTEPPQSNSTPVVQTLPSFSIPTLPAPPRVPSMPSMPSVPTMPSMPSVPALPDLPDLPSAPALPDLPSMPAEPAAMPSIPGLPGVPSLPTLPTIPTMPGAPDVPPTSTAGTTAAGGAAGAAGGLPSMDELVRRLFDPLAARLKAELRLDRERAGLITDLRR